MPGFYNKGDLRFAYPENWTIEDETIGAADLVVTATSPQTAFWTVMVYEGEQDVRQLADCVVDTLKSEYPQLEVEETDDEGFGYDLSFACFDLMNTAAIRTYRQEGRTYLVLSQAEDHELEAVEPVFRAMTVSLLNESSARGRF